VQVQVERVAGGGCTSARLPHSASVSPNTASV
jgi:hypothetical protein